MVHDIGDGVQLVICRAEGCKHIGVLDDPKLFVDSPAAETSDLQSQLEDALQDIADLQEHVAEQDQRIEDLKRQRSVLAHKLAEALDG